MTMMSPAEMIEMFSLQLTSDKPIQQIADRVPAACEQNNFALLQTYHYHEIVESKGFPIRRKVFIYEICQAKVAAMMLTAHPEFSIFMPCRIALYEKDGQTIISTMNMDLLLGAVQDDKELYSEAGALFGKLKAIMESVA